MTERGWHAFPSLAEPKVLIGPRDTVANALKLYSPASPRGRRARALFRLLPDSVSRHVLPRLTDSSVVAQLDAQSARVAALARLDAARISLSPGTPGPERKSTAQLSDATRVLAYAKLATNAATADLLRSERRTLDFLGAHPPLEFGYPQALAFEDSATHAVLVQSAAPPGSRLAGPELRAGHVRALASLATLAPGQCAFDEWSARFEIDRVTQSSGAVQLLIDRALLTLAAHFRGVPVRTCFAHADFAPWNMRMCKEGMPFIFDWEFAQAQMPVLNDLLHYVFMPGALGGWMSATAIGRLLLDTARRHAPDVLRTRKDAPCLDASGVEAYVLLYLLRLSASPFLRDRRGGDFLAQCLQSVLSEIGMPGTRPRVLVSAYACEPSRGSEPAVGWNMACAVAERFDVCVITRANNAPVIEEQLARFPNPHLRFEYVDLPPWARFWKRKGRGILLYSYLWQLLAWRRAHKLCKAESFALAHHVTFVNDWMFSFVPFLPLPSVWGPIGSHPAMPRKMARNRSVWLSGRARKGLQQLLACADPLFWIASRRAHLIIGIGEATKRRVPLRLVERGRWRTHTAIGVERLQTGGRPARSNAGLRVLSSGRFVALKGFDLALSAFGAFAVAEPHAHFTMIGEGPDRPLLDGIASDLKLLRQVEFKPWLPRTEALAAFHDADVFLFPSLEGGGMVVLEAMAAGLPVVCVDFGGPGSFVADGCGVRVAPTSRTAVIAALAAALGRYATDRDLLRRHGENAAAHVKANFLWPERARVIEDWYRSVTRLEKHGRSLL